MVLTSLLWGDVGVAIAAVLIAGTTLVIYKYLRTPYILLIVVGFTYFAIVRALIALDEAKAINYSGDFVRFVTGFGYIPILVGMVGLFFFVRKAFIEAARLLKQHGAELPDTWKNLDDRIEKLKERSDKRNNGRL